MASQTLVFSHLCRMSMNNSRQLAGCRGSDDQTELESGAPLVPSRIQESENGTADEP